MERERGPKSMKKMKDEAGQRPEDMETSDRNYAIAAVQNIVGIDGRVKQITDLLEMEVDDGVVRIVGIFGTNGIGKTTLAKAVYDRISSCFNKCSFLAEVEETLQDPHGIKVLETKLIRDILKQDCEDPSFDERKEKILYKFGGRKVLLVVDDVEEESRLRDIVQLDQFGPGSRIIVTSQNERILEGYDPEKVRMYRVGKLDDGQALELFREYAFRMQSSIPDYDALANRIVNATEKLPLAVEVIGSFLRGKSIQEWAKMEESMKAHATSSKFTVGLEEILDICYERLNKQQKHVFLDLACFISGVDARIASCMWPSSYRPSSGCILMPLAKIGENNELQMHRLPRCLGKRILNQEESQDPRSRRFCTQDMVPKAINREKGTGNVEALYFDFTAGDFQSMRNARFLKLDNAKISGDFEGAFPSLRGLCWQRCPADFSAENLVLSELVILDLSWSKVTEDWGGWRNTKMEKLKVLNLTGCSDLLFTPDFSSYKDLEILILEGCSHLVKLDPSIGHLKRLVSLNVKFCSRLNTLPEELGCLTALKELFIDGTSVRKIPISVGNLNQLETLTGLKCFSLTHLPRSISFLAALSELSLDGAQITELPSSLGDLLNLRRLSLSNCCRLEALPGSVGLMGRSLEELDISATNISELPCSIGNLQNLRVLRMDYSFIRAFPREIGNLTKLEELHASWSWSLTGAIPSDIKRLHHLGSLMLGHSMISSLPPEISTIPRLHTLDLIQCNDIEELPKLPPSLICLRVSSKRMKAIPLLEGLKELEELCLSDGDPKERRPPSKRPMPEHNMKQTIDEQSFSISFPKLRKLKLSLSQIIKLKFEPTYIPQLKMLTHAGLSCKEVSDLPKALSVLKLYDSAIVEIEGLEGLEALKRLDISNCRIQNLDGICQLTSLRSLILSCCDHLDILPDISNLRSLKVLEIRRCKMIRRIEGMEKLTSLEKLDISNCKIRNLDGIGQLTLLRSLILSYCDHLDILPDISNLRSLKVLEIRRCKMIRQIEGMEKLTSLEKLDISNCRIRNLDGIGQLTSLRSLILSYCDHLDILPDISNLRSLKVLEIRGCKMILQIEGTEKLTSLEKLDISNCRTPNLDGIGQLTSLRSLILFNCDDLDILPDISNLRSLKVLEISGCKMIRQIEGIEKLTSLEKLDLSNCRIQNLDGIGQLTSLRSLILSYCDHLDILPDISNFRSLKVLEIKGSKTIRQIEGIGKLTSLERLDISNRGIRNLDGIGQLTSLRSLILSYCDHLDILPDISNLRSLKVLEIRGCKTIRQIEGIEKLTSLEELDISNCGIRNLDGIGQLTSLRSLILSYSVQLDILPDFSNLRSLKVLEMRGCKMISQIEGIEKLASLEKLDISNCSTPNLDGIGQLTSLRSLILSDYDDLDILPNISNLRLLKVLEIRGCKMIRQIEGIERLTSLEKLDISNCKTPNLVGIGQITSLRSLIFSNCDDLNIEGIEKLTSLEKLDISNCRTQNLDGIGQLTSLRSLILSDCDEIDLLPDISNLRSLKVLEISGCKMIRQIEGIEKLTSLEKLDLSNCRIRNLDWIGQLTSLRSLILSYCNHLDILPDFSNLRSLKVLEMRGCKMIRQIEGIEKLTSLEELDISECPAEISVQMVEKIKDEAGQRAAGMETSDSNYTTTSVRSVVGIDDRAKQITDLMEMEVDDESMGKMKDEAGERPGDMEASDRNYAIAAVQNIVGIDGRVKQITDLLEMEVNDEVRILGIFGTNGIGKTTLAKAVYDCISSCFDGHSFLTEVEETTQDPSGIQVLQTRLIRDILERDREDSSFDERIEDFLDIFCERKVLLVVDDVEEKSHLCAIVGDQLHRFGPGSRIIVTSQNEEILKGYDPEKARTYPVSALEDGQAFELFCMHAFRMQSSIPDYDGLVNRIVKATEKLPLAVEVVGSFLRGKSIQEWAKMKKSMEERTRSSRKTTVGPEEILDMCCREFDQQQKDIFLDIACFISGVDARIASYMWPNCYLPISGCILMPLAKTAENNELQMHRLLRCLGKRICKQEESQDPRSRRFCTQDMVLKQMNREEGMENVEVLCFDFRAGDFQSMPKIRFLKLDNAKVSGNFAGAFASLRWLCWQRCPPDFDAENLVLRELAILELPRGKITEEWGGWSKIKMEKLKVLNLTGCSDLLFTPNFSGYKYLEILILESCSCLVKLDPSIGELKRLVSLNLKFCSRLNWLPVELGGMAALEELFIDGTSVREIPISIGNLNRLKTLTGFQCFPLTHLPSSISYLTALSELSLDGAKISELPSSLGELLKLRRLSLRDCRHLEELPDSIGKIGSSLEELDISATNISELPGSIGNLKSLKVLRMDSSFIRAFPGEIRNLTNLEELHASWCRSLKGAIPGDIEGLCNLRSLTLGYSRISSLPPEISTIPGLHTLDLIQCNEIKELPKLPPSLICLRVSSKRMKAIPLLEDLKELEELCLSDGDPKACQHPSKQPMLESKVKLMIDKPSFSLAFPKLKKLELSLSQVVKLKFEPTGIPQQPTIPGLSPKEVSEFPKTLSVFKLYHSAIEETEGLERLKALKRLDISNCKIQNLHGIGHLTSLRSLILSDCDCLSLPDLSNLKSLKVLEIRRCKMIYQIEGLEKLTSLEKLNISECPAEKSMQVENVMARLVVS